MVKEKKEHEEESWNIKRIIISVVVIGFIFGIAYFVFDLDSKKSGFIKGVSNKKESNEEKKSQLKVPSFHLNSSNLQEKLDELKKQVNKLNLTDLATSSPQVQKIIHDLQTLQQLPRNQLKEACLNVCRGL